ncbi:MAG: hypothetical protein ACE5GF_08655 [Thermodesulfobacteriota bacterium]
MILSLATVGVIASTFMVGGLTWFVLTLLKVQAPPSSIASSSGLSFRRPIRLPL